MGRLGNGAAPLLWVILAAVALLAMMVWAIDTRVRVLIRMLVVIGEALDRVEGRVGDIEWSAERARNAAHDRDRYLDR